MQNRRRKRKMRHRICLILFACTVLSLPKFVQASAKVEKGGYWLDKDTFITEYTIPAVYCGEGKFVDLEGYVRDMNDNDFEEDFVAGDFKEGRTYLLYMSDYGTEEPGDDDVIGVR